MRTDGMSDSYNENITYEDDSLPYPSMFHFVLLVVVVGICLVYQYELFKLLWGVMEWSIK